MRGFSEGTLRSSPRAWGILLAAVLCFPPQSSGQSITTGVLQGIVRTKEGEPLSDAAVTVEDFRGGIVRELVTSRSGSFTLRMMLPGTYHVLVEVIGYQPVRLRGVIVASGRTTSVAVELVEKPPPITSVTEISQAGTMSGPIGRVVMERELRSLEYRPDASDVSRGMSEVVAPLDGREGFAVAAGGLPGSRSRVYVDGAPEILTRHPGLRGEPALLAAFPRDALVQGQVSGSALDPEWRGNSGSVLSLITRSGGNRLEFAPFVSGSSAKLGGNSALNPADSSATSVIAGFTLSGPIKRDTAHFFLQGGYQSLETPSPFPWEEDPSLASTVRDGVLQVAQDRYGTNVGSTVLPAVATRKGGAGLARLDWQVGRNSRVMLRGSASSFQETSPVLGSDVGNDAGAKLSSRDISVGASLTSVAILSNELRVGASLTRRDWKGVGLPETRVVSDGIRFGGNAALPGEFESQLLSLTDAVHYQGGSHALKAGVSVDLVTYKQNYEYGSSGRFLYGGVDQFQNGAGAFFRTKSNLSETKVSAPEVGFFVQDNWAVSPGFALLLGMRYETQILPRNRITSAGLWRLLSGLVHDSVPSDRRGIEPRIGFVLNPGNAGDWTLQGGVGLYSSGMDLHQFSEVLQHVEGNTKVQRVVGTLSWPQLTETAGANLLTVLGAPGQFRAPRALKGDFAIARAFPGGLNFRVSGAYHHTDYLTRRADANLAQAPFGEAQDGRPVWGQLQKQGGLVTVSPGTSRRFSAFDLVSVLSPTGFSDYYEAGIALAFPLGRSLSVSADYTFSRTEDNLVGLLAPDPADQFSPFPGGINGQDWDKGRSDLDIPHRVAASVEFRSSGKHPISLLLRGRYRSGLAFTPGFRSGVDVNGDLGGNNDPVAAEAVGAPSGGEAQASCERVSVGGFAARNSCRQSGVGSLDARVGLPLPIGGDRAGRVLITIEAFNLLASRTGVVDRAALLIDPAAALSANSSTGAVQIPYASNPRFGTLLRRGGDSRVVRLGLMVEY